MRKRLLPVLCVILLLFAGCTQQSGSSSSISGLKAPSKTQAPATNRNEGAAVAPSPVATDGAQNLPPTSTPASPRNDSKEEAGTKTQTGMPASPPKAPAGAKVVEIKEKLFIQQCDDIYMNPADYQDKIIKLEGMYQEYVSKPEGKTYRYIYRRTPGCCGADGQAGFQFTYNGKAPKPNDWIKATGTIEVVKDSTGYEDVILHLTELEVSDKRGAEFVTY